MQFGHTLDRLLREILFADPKNGPVRLIKIDISDGFYRVGIVPSDIPKLGVIFPSMDPKVQLVAFPLVLPMGWKNSPPHFSATTETIADIANHQLQQQMTVQQHHHLDVMAAPMDKWNTPTTPPSVHTAHAVPTPTVNDPHLKYYRRLLRYVDVYVDNFIAASQGSR